MTAAAQILQGPAVLTTLNCDNDRLVISMFSCWECNVASNQELDDQMISGDDNGADIQV